jgi:hypothetical protein
MECPTCGYILGPLDTDCPRCKAGYVPPAMPAAPVPSPPLATEALRFCPRCQQEITPEYENCPRCVDPTPFLRPVEEQHARRWHPLDIVMAAAMAAFVLLLIVTGSYQGILGLIMFLVAVVVYGLVLADIWQDENSFGTYAYILTAWELFWAVIDLILVPHSIFRYAVLAVQLAILAGLWKRYGSPMGR